MGDVATYIIPWMIGCIAMGDVATYIIPWMTTSKQIAVICWSLQLHHVHSPSYFFYNKLG
jgi:hypothetical protein